MNPSILKTIALGLLAPISMWIFMGCMHPNMPSDSKTVSINPALEEPSLPPPEDEFYTHKVRWSGETLSIIAQWYTGSHRNWKTVARANPDLNPKRISDGDEILIPTNLLKTNESMPREYLRSPSRQKKYSPSPRMKPAIESKETDLVSPQDTEQSTFGFEEIELFGPQDKDIPISESDEIELFGPKDTEHLETESDDIELFER